MFIVRLLLHPWPDCAFFVLHPLLCLLIVLAIHVIEGGLFQDNLFSIVWLINYDTTIRVTRGHVPWHRIVWSMRALLIACMSGFMRAHSRRVKWIALVPVCTRGMSQVLLVMMTNKIVTTSTFASFSSNKLIEKLIITMRNLLLMNRSGDLLILLCILLCCLVLGSAHW